MEANMRTDYDAFEFTTFMETYLENHPGVVEDQRRGWDIYWNAQLSQSGQEGGWGDEHPDLELLLDDELQGRFVPVIFLGHSHLRHPAPMAWPWATIAS